MGSQRLRRLKHPPQPPHMPQQPADEIVVAVNIVKIRSLFMAVLSFETSQVGGETGGRKGRVAQIYITARDVQPQRRGNFFTSCCFSATLRRRKSDMFSMARRSLRVVRFRQCRRKRRDQICRMLRICRLLPEAARCAV